MPILHFLIERFHSRGHQPCKFIGTKESVYKEESNSHRIGLVHQHGRRFIVLYTNMAAVTSCENALYKIHEEVLVVGVLSALVCMVKKQ